MSGRIILLTGVMASGKSTVAQALAERLPRSVHLRGDVFRKMIVNGRAEMGPELSPDALAQLQLRYGLAIEAARGYAGAGFHVVYQDMILGETLNEVADAFSDNRLTIVVLCPDRRTVAEREAKREKAGYKSPEEIAFFDRVLHEETPRLGLWIDSSALTVDDTVNQIIAKAGLSA